MIKIVSVSITLILLIWYIFFILTRIISSKSFTTNPFFINLILFFFILLISLNISTFFSSYWFSFIIFLIIIGGIIILFLYFTRICPNELLFIPLLNLISFLLKYLYFNFLITLFIIYFDIFSFFSSKKSNEISKFNLFINLKFLINLNSFNLNYIFIYPIIKISLFIIFYLLFTLIIVSKLCKNNNKPLRQLKK